MCGAAAWTLSASGLSHFSITTNASGPNGVWNLPMSGVSVAGPYSMQPFSACTAGMLARNSRRMSSRMPGLAVMMAMTWVMGSTSSVGSWYLEGRDYHLTAGRPSRDRVEGRHVRSARVRSHPGRGRSRSPACSSAYHSIASAAASCACTRPPAVVARQYVGPRGLALIGTGRAVLVSPTSRGIMGHDITHKAQDRRSMATPLTSSLARDVTNLLEHLGVTTQSHKDGTLIVRSPIT